MASQEELNRQNQLNDEKNEQISLEKELIAILARRVGIDSSILNDQQDISNTLKDQVKFLKFQNAEKSLLTSLTTKIGNIAKDSYAISQDQLGLEQTNNKLAKDRQTLKTSLILLEQQQKKFSKENAELDKSIAESIGEQVKQTKILLYNLDKIEKTSNAVSKNFGVKTFGALSDITKKIPGLSRFSEPFQQASEAARETAVSNIKANELSKLGSKIKKEDITRLGLQNELIGKNGQILTGRAAQLKAQNLGLLKTNSTLMAGVKSLGPALTKALGPIGIIMELVTGLFKANTEVVELKKSMALSSVEATSFRLNLANAAAESGNINITTSKLLETFSAVNKQFGFITNFATNTLVTMTKLTKVVGVSSESAGNLAAASERTGTSFESNYKDVLGTSYELQRQSGVQMDLRDILDQTGKVTGTVRANLGANPTQIAKAITQAKLFGASLQDVANAGKSMLDFESSITAELEAELLLGKDINLERARAAALAGDQVTLAQELQKEAGTFSDFTKMNVIQQEALAKAMGMTSDQLADILFQQEVQGKSAKELRALGKDELAQRLESQTAAQSFNATMEKLQSIIVDVVGAFAPILDIVSMVAQAIGKVFEVVGPFKGMLAGAAAGTAIAPGIGTAIGFLLGGISDVASATSTADDAVIPAGYGETIIKKGKDTIALNNNDTVVAGTNLMGSTQSAPVQDNTETKRTNQLLERLISQPSVFKIGTDEFYTATSKYSYQVQ
jgi:hypothetical protein